MVSGNVWSVPATVLRVVDGDTLILLCDLGWHISYEARCRLIGVNAPEMDTDAGRAAKHWVIDKLGFGGPESVTGWTVEVLFISHKLDKYGRPLGQVMVTSQQGDTYDLGLELLNAGHAVPMSD